MASSETPVMPKLEITTSRQLLSWLAEQKNSIALTTFQMGELYFIGLKSENTLSVFERSFSRRMGLCATSTSIFQNRMKFIICRIVNVMAQC